MVVQPKMDPIRKWMTNRFIYILLLVFPFPGFAQQFEIRFGDVEKMGFREMHESMAGFNDHSFESIRYKFSAFGDLSVFADHISSNTLMKEYSVEVYRKDLYKNNQLLHKIEFEDVFKNDSSIIVFFSHFNPDNLEHSMYMVQYQDGYLIDIPVKILSTKSPHRFEKNEFIIERKPNKNLCMVIGIEPELKTKLPLYKLVVINENLEVVWKQNLEIPYKENRFELEQAEVDQQGNAFMLFRVILNKDQQKQKNLPNADYYFSLLQLSANQDDDYLETVINIEDKNLYNMWMDVSSQPGNILLSGLYYNKKSDLKPKGVYFTSFPKDSIRPGIIKTQSFGDDFIPDFETESPFTEITADDPNVRLIDFLATPDGGYYLLAEYEFINETCLPDYRSGLMSCNYNYYYNEIFIFKFDSTGSLERKYIIPKKQFTRNDGGVYSSFSYAIIKDKLVLWYNDHSKNLKPKNPSHLQFMTDPKKSNLAAVTIEKNGIINKEFIINNDKRKTWCKPRVFFPTSDQGIIMIAERGRMFQHIEIKPSN